MSFSPNPRKFDTPSVLSLLVWIGSGPLIGAVLLIGSFLFN